MNSILFGLLLLAIPILAVAERRVVSPEEGPVFARESLALMDKIMPKMVRAVRRCDSASAKQLRDEVHQFLKERWGWYTSQKALEPHWYCFAALSDVMTLERYAREDVGVPASTGIGLFNAKLTQCKQSIDPGVEMLSKDANRHWPDQYGSEVYSCGNVRRAIQAGDSILHGGWQLERVEGRKSDQYMKSIRMFSFERSETCHVSYIAQSGKIRESECKYQIKDSVLYMWPVSKKKIPDRYEYTVEGSTLRLKDYMKKKPTLYFRRAE